MVIWPSLPWLPQAHQCLGLARAKKFLDPFVTLPVCLLELLPYLLWHHPLWLSSLSWFSSSSTNHTSSVFGTDNCPALPLTVSAPQRSTCGSCLFNLHMIILVSSNEFMASTTAQGFFFPPILFSILCAWDTPSRHKSTECWTHNECAVSINWWVNEWMNPAGVQKCYLCWEI